MNSGLTDYGMRFEPDFLMAGANSYRNWDVLDSMLTLAQIEVILG